MYDVIVVGGGPAGMTAGIYAKRAGLNVAMIERLAPGGQLINYQALDNYTGFIGDAPTLVTLMHKQTEDTGVEIIIGEVLKIEVDEAGVKHIITEDNRYQAKAVILATGNIPKKLNVENEEPFLYRGISWCAICDGPFYKGKDVIVVGGGKSGVEEGYYLSNLAKSVTLIHRSEKLKAEAISIKLLESAKNVKIILNSTIKRFLDSNGKLSGALIVNKLTNEETVIPADGVFVYVGMIPVTDMVKHLDVYDELGYLKVNSRMETSVPGIFGAGDVNQKEIRQVATAVGDGSIAAQFAAKYVEQFGHK
jgi:thioredoxin reductase (NADPH)